MFGVTDLYQVLYHLGYKFDRDVIIQEEGFIVVEIKSLFNRWSKLSKEQIKVISSMLSPNYKIKIRRKVFKWILWEEIIIGGQFLW